MLSSTFVRYRPVVSVIGQQTAVESYSWDVFLEKVLAKLERCSDLNTRCIGYVVPAESFYQAPFAEYMKYIDTDIKLELALRGDYDAHLTTPLEMHWFARVMKVAGYRLLLRYEGMDCPEDKMYDFWVNIGSGDVKPVGYCAEKPEVRALVPPEAIHQRQKDWEQYILCQIHAYKTIVHNWPEVQIQKLSFCKFKTGDLLELLDSTVSMRVRPARVEKVIGSRILVRVEQEMLAQSARQAGDEGDSEITEGVWMDQDSPLIFPVGWAYKVGYSLSANEEYAKHAKEIANALKSKSTKIPYVKHDTQPSLFKTYIETEAKEGSASWEKGMKLEVLDPLDTWKELRVATVLEVLGDGYLKIGFDGEEMEEDPVPLHASSELLFPVGYAKKYGIRLKGPKDAKVFEWNAYLKQSKSIAAPDELFDSFGDDVLSNFKIGAKLEATDMCEPHLICAATVQAHRGRLLQIRYDGWDDAYDQLFDYRSPNIFPLGWCEMHGYKLEAPRISNVKKRGKKKKGEVKGQEREDSA